ncbi:MAG: alpha/beta fold hydrolase [Rhodospirillales bacterium]|nr:alpha/beta fold hydrolase [Rhodospirillales bacterium]
MSLDLAYSETGSGEPVVIIHGLFGWKRNWATIAKHLGESHRVYTLDMRNHGESPHAPAMTYAQMADDIAQFISSQKIGPCPVIGHSMGGKASMTLALTQAELVQRLLILDIAPVAYSHDYDSYVSAMKQIDLAAISRRSDVQPAIASIAENPSVEAFLMQNLTTDTNGRYRWRINLDAIDHHMSDIMGFPAINSERAYPGPTLFLGGRNSDRIVPQYEAEIHRLFPAATVDFIDGAGHWVHADQPAAVLDRFRLFLA